MVLGRRGRGVSGFFNRRTGAGYVSPKAGDYGVGPGDSIGFSVRYQGELLGLRDQNRDLRQKSPPEWRLRAKTSTLT